MLVSRERFVEAVLSCVGTPVAHMGRCIGAALDCVGVPIAALAAAGGPMIHTEPYANPPGCGALHAALHEHCTEVAVDESEAGDLLVVLWKGAPLHVVVHVGHDRSGRLLVVHARAASGVVVREAATRGFRIASCWRLKEVV